MADGYITGRVTGSDGPEAGVWVIAETDELRTPFTKIVVTDDEGRYTLPELPEATYRVWVRGYGLVDSAPVEGRPGDRDLALTAVVAPSPAEAARVYPADYWYSLYAPPAESEFPGTGPSGNGVAETMLSQKMWLDNQKSQCNFCHQVGNALTRSLDHMKHLNLGSSQATWDYRTQLGVLRLNVRSTAFSGVGLVLSFGAVLVLLTWWVRHIRATRRERDAGSGAAAAPME